MRGRGVHGISVRLLAARRVTAWICFRAIAANRRIGESLSPSTLRRRFATARLTRGRRLVECEVRYSSSGRGSMDNQGLLREIQGGESKTLELKESLPAKSKKYVKTLVAFANSSGGKLVIGVRDGDREIVGVEDAALAADSIANALSDSCEPMLTPPHSRRKRWIPECRRCRSSAWFCHPLSAQERQGRRRRIRSRWGDDQIG